jgi:hypothetical protein
MSTRSTHVLEMADGRMVKRFRSWDRGEHQRQWRALNVLAEFAPGPAPIPLDADLDADPPSVTMTQLPGEPLAEERVTAAQLDALAGTLDRLHTCIPPVRSLASSRRYGYSKGRASGFCCSMFFCASARVGASAPRPHATSPKPAALAHGQGPLWAPGGPSAGAPTAAWVTAGATGDIHSGIPEGLVSSRTLHHRPLAVVIAMLMIIG